jgi:hypothetical protein
MPHLMATLDLLSKLSEWRNPAMAKCDVDPSNLKSFQRISLEDLSYLKDLDQAVASSKRWEAPPHGEIGRKDRKLHFLPRKFFNMLKDSLDKLLYETVPVNEVYAARE